MVPFLAATDIFFLRYHLRIRLSRRCCSERPGAVKGAPLLGAAKRILDGEDRSETIAEEGKAGRKIGKKWSAKMVPSPTASNKKRVAKARVGNNGSRTQLRPYANGRFDEVKATLEALAFEFKETKESQPLDVFSPSA
jgi:hypothetical protein